ncbi:recombination and repair protein [Oleiphilus messinensis]|uniref:DNA repair protein RecN n=1 Tax=Oleiphilus messinensis TaxID=141451 RepID=A0A1Y0I4Z2_9GAMM|nr:DNA repair protein RecN [Oleiphilus messinensis]ARU55558.1 recombination and repair protein [Oleiphilus messinensis]
MLIHLTVSNFAIAERVELSFEQGMTVITGETGAGKSIVLDALGLTLGDRADSGIVRYGKTKAELTATFDISQLPAAHTWLAERDLDQGPECILRRVITKEGRSRGYINGQPAPLQNLRQLGELLIDIHSQHEHQSLLRKDTHKQLLDAFGNTTALAQTVKQQFKNWSEIAQKLEQLKGHSDERHARQQLLSYQLQELEQLDLQEGEIETLEQEQNTLANAEKVLQTGHQVITICADGDNTAHDLISQACQLLENLPVDNEHFNETRNLLSEAIIQIDEAGSSLRHFLDTFELDPERLQFIEERLSSIYQLARKHRVEAHELIRVREKMSIELAEMTDGEDNLEVLEAKLEDAGAVYATTCEKLTKKRSSAADKLSKLITQQLAHLNMSSATFTTCLTPTPQFHPGGMESIEFMISANPGQPPQPLIKVASGGELSRVSLAIQVILAESSTIPTLVFDEVDVGIGGSTAEVVGQMLRKLGSRGQVLCVTHLPQVASQGHTHLEVSKTAKDGETHSKIRPLSQAERITEVARMLGGVEITERSLDHAKEMLSIE